MCGFLRRRPTGGQEKSVRSPLYARSRTPPAGAKTAKGALGFTKKAGKAPRAARKIADKGDPAKDAAILKKVLVGARDVILAVTNLAGFKAGSMKDVPLSFANS